MSACRVWSSRLYGHEVRPADRVVVELPGEQVSHLGSAQAAAQAGGNPIVEPEVVMGELRLERALVRVSPHGAAQAREEEKKKAGEAARSHRSRLSLFRPAGGCRVQSRSRPSCFA